MKTPKLAVIMAILTITLLSCAKNQVQPNSLFSSVNLDARVLKACRIEFNWHYRAGEYANFYDSVGELMATGDVVYDSCYYDSNVRSTGTIKVSGEIPSPWTIVISEKRSKSSYSIGNPYYWIQYGSDAPIQYFSSNIKKDIRTGKLTMKPDSYSGPFKDSTCSGTGNRVILFSDNKYIKSGNGTLTFEGRVWYGFSRFSEGGDLSGYTPSEAHRILFPTLSTLTGHYN